MKFVMDERVKHRLTGLVVILAISVVFLPALMKKSTHHFEEHMSLSVNLPPKPPAPKVDIADKNVLFQSVKVVHVDIPPAVVATAPRLTQIAKAEPLSIKSFVQPTPSPVAKTAVALVKAKQVVAPVVKVAAIAPQKLAQSATAGLKKEMYAVQLGSFAQQNNAKVLVSRLRSKGYIASYSKFSGKQGEFYQVIVGQLNQKDAATMLQKQLVVSMQLNGFVIKKGVS